MDYKCGWAKPAAVRGLGLLILIDLIQDLAYWCKNLSNLEPFHRILQRTHPLPFGFLVADCVHAIMCIDLG